MEGEKIGAFRIDEHGNTVPDLTDEAMAARIKLEKEQNEAVSIETKQKTWTKKKEVTENATG